MPLGAAAVLPSVVTAGAGLLGAGIGAFSQHKATQAQSKATQQALDFQKQQEATRRAAYDKAMQQYEAKWNAWNNSRNALLQRYGINVQSATPSGMMGGGDPMQQPGAVPRQDPMMGQPPMGGPVAPPQAPMAPGGQMDIQLPQRAQTVGALMRPELRYGMAR